MKNEEIDKYVTAGLIAKEVSNYAKKIIKKDIALLKIAEEIENKIVEKGGAPAFPVNLSINEIAAHCTPNYNEQAVANGLLKVDIGVQIEGFIADTAFSIDLEESEKNKELILASEEAVKKASEKINEGVKLADIGKVIEETIHSFKKKSIWNLSGHLIERYNLHAGIVIPNIDNSQNYLIEEGVYAIEPFATTGLGYVKDGKKSGIYKVEKINNVRDEFARKVLLFILEKYKTLPFCSRWIYKEFGLRGLSALQRLEEAKIVNQFYQLIEAGREKVAQTEHTIVITKEKKIITTI